MRCRGTATMALWDKTDASSTPYEKTFPSKHAVRGWREVTCQRCLGSIHAKLVQWQPPPPESPRAPQRHSRQSGGAPGTRLAALLTARPLLLLARRGET